MKKQGIAQRIIYTASFVLVSCMVNAQVTDTAFRKEWTAIDSLILKNDLTRTALEKVNTLYRKAKLQHQPGQVIKTLLYRYSLEDRITTDKPDHIISSIKTEINAASDETEKAVLNSLLAKQYRQYYNNHRWNLYSRKNTQGLLKDDITTWSNDEFISAITFHYLASVKNKKALQQKKIETYDAIIIKGNTRKLRPTLFDLLAHEALDYFKSGDSYTTQPLNAFIINNEKSLRPMDDFIPIEWPTRDSSSLPWLALDLFRQLLIFHRNDTDKNALVDVDLERIEWVYGQAAFSNKKIIYQKTLETLVDQYPRVATTANAWYLLARIAVDKAATYSAFGDTSNHYGYVKAKKIIENALAAFTEINPGTANLRNLLNEINTKELRTETEKVNVPGKPFRALVRFRNTDTLFARIIRINDNDSLLINRGAPDYWKKIAHIPSYRSFIQPLPATADHQPHSTEVLIESLPVGKYALICSNGSGFADTENKICVQSFHVSNISYIKNKNDFFVLNRETGQPIATVKVAIFKQQYDNRLGRMVDEPLSTTTTDKNGYFHVEAVKANYNLHYVFTTSHDRLSLQENEYVYFENNREPVEKDAFFNSSSNHKEVFFFTDRSLYRPGQTVFFKGIAISRNTISQQSKIIDSKDSGWVYLKDVNGKRIDSLRFVLNNYGSFNGKFVLPQNGLTGNFSIETNSFPGSVIDFSVEEYKRPTFNIQFEKPQGAYRLNDTIVLTGTAKAYAGNTIGGAKLVYNITRNTRSPIPWMWRRPIPAAGNREIAHGEMMTDAAGKFVIRFRALADDIIDSTGNPVFDFSIHADITDLNGETRSATTEVSTGFSALLLQLNTPAISDADSSHTIGVLATNLSQEKEPALVRIKIYSLRSPQRLIRKRYWQRPDQFVMSEKEFISHFPTDEYQNETDFITWPTAKLALEATIDTKSSEQFTIPAGSLEVGHYRVEAFTTDKYGIVVKQENYMQLFSRKTDQLPTALYQFTYTVNNKVEPGQTALFLAGTSAPNIFVISKTEKPGNTSMNYNFSIHTNGIKTMQYTPDETDRGGVNISEAYVFDNRVYTNLYAINVPWSNKLLQVSYSSYRDKTAPGSAEKWTVTIQGEKGENAAAELLTAMYDASLDQFKPHNWRTPDIWQTNTAAAAFNGQHNFSASNDAMENYLYQKYIEAAYTQYDRLAANGYELWNGGGENTGIARLRGGMVANQYTLSNSNKQEDLSMVQGKVRQERGMKEVKDAAIPSPSPPQKQTDGIATVIRKNFNETAFFFPELYADSTGKYSFSFTMPDALTQWKWMSFAHTKDLAFGSNSTTILTQKKLMVQPNAPRFMREGDNMEFSTKIANLTDKEITGQVTLELIDPSSNTSVDGWFQNIFPAQYFTVAAGQSMAIKFPIQIPFSFNKPLTWRIIARAGDMSDGEENTLPVLTNRLLVTESLPLFLHGDTTEHFTFDKLLNTTSETLTHEAITVEYTSNPVWYAVQALPYLMEYPYECAEQTFNRFYANTLASYIVSKHPRIKKILEQWKADTTSLQSNLQKNEELKQILLQETPWVLEAESEAQQKKNISLLFDAVKLSTQSDTWIEKLRQMQLPNGSFSWFKGGLEDRYMTNYILTGIGKLKRLGALTPDLALRIRTVLVSGIQYMDRKLAEDYSRLLKSKAMLSNQQINNSQIDYLYMRSFFRDIAQQSPEAYMYYYKQGKQYWINQNSFYKAVLGLIYYRNKDESFAKNSILPALIENVSTDTKLGMYWKSSYTGHWYQSPIEHQSMMIAFMSEINEGGTDASLTKNINAMKTWLLLNKQTNNWRTTIATADACYALLLNGTDWLNNDKQVTIVLGSNLTVSGKEKTEAGTGYFKKRIDGRMVNPSMGNITVSTMSDTRTTNKANNQSGDQPSWGSIYWQYFEEMDKITASATPLSLRKKIFTERNTDRGKILELVKEGDELKTGDKVVVRMELRSDRDMEYLHLKDMRAAAMEPVNVLSGYKWQDALGYYESTKDASTNFFISYLSKGTYVFEYPLFITHAGIFSAGIATIQCMYAPEFTSHSEGIKIRVINPKP